MFDTLMIRSNSSEARRYFQLSDRISKTLASSGYAAVDTSDVFLARCEALLFGYRTSLEVERCIEGRIEEVISNQVKMLDLPSACDEIFLEEEIAFETESLTPNQALIDLAEDFAKRGGKVILVSDMYLSGQAIDQILRRRIRRDGFEYELFSSADTVRNKRSGTIFPWLESRLDVPSSHFLHIGDSYISDFRQPKSFGWHAFHTPISEADLSLRKEDLERFLSENIHKGLDLSFWARA
ncbi:hypothetical protein ACFQY9_16710 [Microvirga aerilata]|uniref:hypothetical protein n=1 Tax=Microvirga aerilata TaxID=670292 RepID=UPI0036309D42